MRRTRDLDRGACISAARLASANRGQIDIIDIDGPAEGIVRTLPGYLTG